MATHQKQTSTAGQPAQNCVGQSTSHRKSGEQKHVIWEPSPLGQKYFTFKDCKTWNRYKQISTAQYIRAEAGPDYSSHAGLNLPSDPNPWNVLRSVIDQFYQREINIAQRFLKVQETTGKTQKLEEKREIPTDTDTRPENTPIPTYFTLEGCRTYNDFQRDLCKQYSSDCHLLTISENPHPWESVCYLIELYYDRERQLRFALQEIGRLKDEKEKVQEIADIALKGLLKLEEKVNATH